VFLLTEEPIFAPLNSSNFSSSFKRKPVKTTTISTKSFDVLITSTFSTIVTGKSLMKSQAAFSANVLLFS
jgi:hypothetical protein